MSLEAHGLELRLDKRAVVSDVCLEVADGEILGLIGPNGAGKSTLLRGLAGLLPPTAGDVSADGERLRALDARARARAVSFVAQDTAVASDVTTHDLVLMGRYCRRRRLARMNLQDRTSADQALESVELRHLRQRPVQDLSGGERQLAQIARALAQDASTLLLDEPTSALDLHHRLRVFEVLRARAADGAGVAVVLHDLDEAARHCDRIAVIHDGRLHALGPPQEVLTAQLLAHVYRVHAQVETCADHPRVTPIQVLDRSRSNSKSEPEDSLV